MFERGWPQRDDGRDAVMPSHGHILEQAFVGEQDEAEPMGHDECEQQQRQKLAPDRPGNATRPGRAGRRGRASRWGSTEVSPTPRTPTGS